MSKPRSAPKSGGKPNPRILDDAETLDNDIGLRARIAALDLIAAAQTKRNGFDEAGSSAEFMALSESERAFARALALLVLRRLGQLDFIIAKKTQKMPPDAPKALLRIGMAQIFFMQVPDFAAVSTTVKLAERNNNTRPFKGLINAILRGLIREGGLKDVNPQRLVPDWLWQRWKATYGEESAGGIAMALTEEPATDLTFRDMDALKAHTEALEGEAIGGLTLRSNLRGDVRTWSGYDDGVWWVQDAAAAIPVALLGDLTGKTAIDICAAPGGKTLQLLAKGAQVVALDRSKNRLKRVEENLTRLKFSAETHCVDAESFDDDRQFDVVLLDAPCSATGTFRRQPDVLWAAKPSEVSKLADVQHRMLDAVATRVKPGGSLVYATCSLEREEGETQVLAFLRRNKDFTTAAVDTAFAQDQLGLDARDVTAEGWLRLLPHHRKGGQDGFFVAHLKRL
ncbi:RsmB/NOP family class I SAM-dependent RNA methyltransferase [Asticcacaulis endophyticus]|uniref:rRNA methyltransferase n=1 Tax=Asticcacaulis endophyticus TaxID=1395890 RepID=A0A918PVI3_9CAUL|nr:RsmB/NOP family class I SAM-dependent RNA methyltransferase [Asticcacaulis endophyticus]GGZ23601.1 rRNA methyltransferase [Asticcacaulis endophyticus]